MPSFKLIFLAINLVSALAVGIARAKKTAKRKVASLKTIEILVLAGLTLFLCCCCCLCCRCLCKKCPCTCCGHSKGKKAAQDEDSKVEADIEMPEPVLPRRPELCISDYKITPRQNRIRFEPSRVVARYGEQTKCWTCFQERYGLNQSVVKNLYTDDCLYRRLNNALMLECEEQNVLMFAQVLSEAVYQVVEELPDVVYRGIPDLNLDDYANNVGKLIYFWRFTSTSRSREIAMRFTHLGKGKPKSPTAALFEITLLKKRRNCVADLTKQSKYPVEKEILICCNAGFKIDKVDRTNRVIHLTLVDESHCLKAQPTASLCASHLQLSQTLRARSGGVPARWMNVRLPPGAKPGNAFQVHTQTGTLTFIVPHNAQPGGTIPVQY